VDEDDSRRTLAVVLFEGFELLDVFGPLEMLGVSGRFDITTLGPEEGPVASAQGPATLAERAYRRAADADLVLMPGGIGTRRLVGDHSFLEWLADWGRRAGVVASVCTGSGVLAAAGLLDGYRATSNKRAFAWAVSQGPGVHWVPKARWVEDRDRWTSSGVAAGMDMTIGLIGHLCSPDLAAEVAARVEYEPHADPGWDPFAAKYGLA
jgi:transcriptional regulator GlxA family with amidase domain